MPDTIDVLAPKELVLPIISNTTTRTVNKTGTIGISGAVLVFWNGSAWKAVTTN